MATGGPERMKFYRDDRFGGFCLSTGEVDGRAVTALAVNLPSGAATVGSWEAPWRGAEAAERQHGLVRGRWAGREVEAAALVISEERAAADVAVKAAEERLRACERDLERARQEVAERRRLREELQGSHGEVASDARRAGRASVLAAAGLGDLLPDLQDRRVDGGDWLEAAGAEAEALMDGVPLPVPPRLHLAGTGRDIVVAARALDALAFCSVHPASRDAHLVVNGIGAGRGKLVDVSDVMARFGGGIRRAVDAVAAGGLQPRVIVALSGSREEAAAAGAIARYVESVAADTGQAVEVVREGAHFGWFMDMQARGAWRARQAGRAPEGFAAIVQGHMDGVAHGKSR